jgi:hypothetical protein
VRTLPLLGVCRHDDGSRACGEGKLVCESQASLLISNTRRNGKIHLRGRCNDPVDHNSQCLCLGPAVYPPDQLIVQARDPERPTYDDLGSGDVDPGASRSWTKHEQTGFLICLAELVATHQAGQQVARHHHHH